MVTGAAFRTVQIGLAAIVALGIIAYLAALPGERISAQESATATPTATPAATATPTGDLVVAPGVVQMGQTTLAVGLHTVPRDLEVSIRYSGHFTPEGESCDDAGTPGATPSAVAPTWITLNACAVGDGWARLVESNTGRVIEEVSVTVIEPGVIGQAPATVSVSGVTSRELTPGGSGDEFSVRVSELEIATGYELHTVALNGSSAAFDQACTDFKEIDDVIWRGAIKTYTVYGCVATGTYIWSWVEKEDGSVVAFTGLHDHRVNVADPTVSFSSSTYSVDEGDEATITVKLSHKSAEPIFIPITVSNGTAESDDYEVDGLSRSGTLFFAGLATSATFTIDADVDTDADDETVNISFGTLPSTVSGTVSPSTATLTIEDDDRTVSFNESSYSVDEDDDVTITVRLNGESSQDLDIPITVTRGRAESNDYVVGGLANGKLTFSAGDTSATFTIESKGDTDADDETLNLSFGTLPSAVSGTGSHSTATLTILDGDRKVRFGSSSYSVAEGSDRDVFVHLNGQSSRSLEIPITVSRDRAERNDYEVDGLSNGKLTFSAWDVSESFTIDADVDTDADDETVDLGFGTLPDGVEEDDDEEYTSVTLTIRDGDRKVRFSSSSYTVDEGESETIRVRLTGARNGKVVIPITVAESDDYEVKGLSNGNLTFSAWDTSESFTIETDDDTDYEGDETVNIGFGDLPSSVSATDSPSTATLTIRDNDPPPNRAPIITGGLGSVSYAENGMDPVATYTASDPDGDSVTWTLSGIDQTSFALEYPDPKRASPVNLKFITPPDFENPADDGPNNVYDLTLKASDGTLDSPSVSIAVTVLDVKEPPSKPSAPTVSSNGETSLNVAWSAPTNTGPPINGYNVQYSVGNSGLFKSFAHTGVTTQTTISNLSPDTAYDVQVQAKNAEGTGDWSDSGTGSTDAATLMVRIGSQVATVTEGRGASFLLLTNISPATELTVNVSVTETGSFITGTPPSQETIAGGNSAAHLAIQTTNDTVDEANGAITVTVLPGAGYSVGSPSSASVTVQDNDQPPAPTGLRANGNLVGGNVTLRWNPVLGATSYNVRYVEEVCDSNGVCEPDGGATPNWQTRTNIATTAGTAIEATLGGLTKEMLYRVEAQVAIVDASDWSDFTLVFPTDSPLGHGTDVATAPFHGYQAKNARGSHEFRYVLCTETIPTGLTMTATDMKNAVDAWEDTVIWNRSGANIITTTDYTLPASERCSTMGIPMEKGRFEVKFFSNDRIREVCTPHRIVGKGPPACWRSHSWSIPGVELIGSGSALINADYGATHWNHNFTTIGCTRLHETIVHEVGHAFGIGNRTGVDFNRHPINTTHSIMSYEDPNHYCEPQGYDIVALMALYQSR